MDARFLCYSFFFLAETQLDHESRECDCEIFRDQGCAGNFRSNRLSIEALIDRLGDGSALLKRLRRVSTIWVDIAGGRRAASVRKESLKLEPFCAKLQSNKDHGAECTLSLLRKEVL